MHWASAMCDGPDAERGPLAGRDRPGEESPTSVGYTEDHFSAGRSSSWTWIVTSAVVLFAQSRYGLNVLIMPWLCGAKAQPRMR
jgi:hypothetical protein